MKLIFRILIFSFLFTSCSKKRSVEVNLSKNLHEEINFSSYPSASRLRIDIKGSLNCKTNLKLKKQAVASSNLFSKDLEVGAIDTTFLIDWYSDDGIIVLSPYDECESNSTINLEYSIFHSRFADFLIGKK